MTNSLPKAMKVPIAELRPPESKTLLKVTCALISSCAIPRMESPVNGT